LEFSFFRAYRGHHIDHSDLLEKQGNSAVNRRWRRAGDGVGIGRQMVPGGARKMDEPSGTRSFLAFAYAEKGQIANAAPTALRFVSKQNVISNCASAL
jgi:hypothetical protein